MSIIKTIITNFGVLNHAPDGTPVILLQWERPDWTTAREEHVAWVHGAWVSKVVELIARPALPDVHDVIGIKCRIRTGPSGWAEAIGHATIDEWIRFKDHFDRAESQAAMAFN